VSEIDQQFIEYVVKSLVGKPDAVSVERRIDEKGVLLELTVDPEDLGRVIGKRGATAQSLRTLLRALGTKNDARYNLKIIDNGVGGDSRNSADKPAFNQPASPAAPADDNVASNDDQGATADDDTTAAIDDAEEREKEGAEDEASDRLKQTRQELADLDDLDV
jgi:predicted RNA-binding protein YlqC (UPF0109 family)